MTKTMSKIHSPFSGLKAHFSKIAGKLARVGKALLFPIATLPIAAILLRIGAQLPTGTPFADFVQSMVINGGNVVFSNLPMVFAIGVAFGFAKDARGEAAFAGFIGMALLKIIMSKDGVDLTNKIYHEVYDFHAAFGRGYESILSGNVLNGIIAGSLVAWIYNKYNGTELPSALGFFSGRRLIPVLSILTIMLFGIAYAILFPWVGYALNELSNSLGNATGNRYANAGIMGIYGFINRLLIPFGLHHIPNTIFWFTLGSHPDALGKPVNGDIFIFLNGVPKGNTAGTFQSGFFPIMMFVLPAMAAAFYITADDKEQKRRVSAIFGSAALVSFLTGITEPIEFAFLFIAPGLFFMHAVLTGVFGFITGLFGIQLGFGFSAGLLDYILSIPKSMDIIHANKSGIDAIMANPGWLWVIGAVAASTYFFLTKFFILKYNLPTPGRGEGRLDVLSVANNSHKQGACGFSNKAKAFVKALGGWDNITKYDHCITRLRYDVKDSGVVDDKALKKAGAIGVIKISKTHVQVVVGTTVEILNNEIVANKGEKV